MILPYLLILLNTDVSLGSWIDTYKIGLSLHCEGFYPIHAESNRSTPPSSSTHIKLHCSYIRSRHHCTRLSSAQDPCLIWLWLGVCIDIKKSITRYLTLFGNSPVSWKFKKKHTVSKSSFKAKYWTMATIASEITWLFHVLKELGVTNLWPVTDVLTKIISSTKLQPLLTKLGMLATTPSLRRTKDKNIVIKYIAKVLINFLVIFCHVIFLFSFLSYINCSMLSSKSVPIFLIKLS